MYDRGNRHKYWTGDDEVRLQIQQKAFIAAVKNDEFEVAMQIVRTDGRDFSIKAWLWAGLQACHACELELLCIALMHAQDFYMCISS